MTREGRVVREELERNHGRDRSQVRVHPRGSDRCLPMFSDECHLRAALRQRPPNDVGAGPVFPAPEEEDGFASVDREERAMEELLRMIRARGHPAGFPNLQRRLEGGDVVPSRRQERHAFLPSNFSRQALDRRLGPQSMFYGRG